MILVVTGPPAAGKSTIGPIVAKMQDKCAVIDVDLLRAMIVKPHVPPWEGEEGRKQLDLGVENGCVLARNFNDAGFQVVILDVLTNATAATYRNSLSDLGLNIALLLPTVGTALERNHQRGQWLKDSEVELLYQWQLELVDFDIKIDNSNLSIEEAANQLFCSLDRC